MVVSPRQESLVSVRFGYVVTLSCHNVRPVLACGLFYWLFTITHVMWFLSQWKYNENFPCLLEEQFSANLIEVVWLKEWSPPPYKMSLSPPFCWPLNDQPLLKRRELTVLASISASLAMFLELKDKFGSGCFLWEFLSCIRVKKITPRLYLSVGWGQGKMGAGSGVFFIHPQVIVTVESNMGMVTMELSSSPLWVCSQWGICRTLFFSTKLWGWMWKLRLPVAWNSSGIMHAAELPPSGEEECRLLMETWLWSLKAHLVHIVSEFFL